jgi:hypothetical protein
MAPDFLQAEGAPVNPVVESYGPQDQSITRFTTWHITVHRTLPGVGSAGLVVRLPLCVT